MPKPIRTLGSTIKPNAPHIKECFLNAQKIFAKHGIELLLEQESAKTLNLEGITMPELIAQADSMVSFGGDGTLLSLCRHLYGRGIPIFGINTGNLGFLTAISPEEIHSFAENLSRGDYVLQSHMMLQASLNEQRHFAINEFLICQDVATHSILEIHALIESKPFNIYRADSLIIATPTGSTAYNISAGGSIIYPLCRNILLTPVAPHTLTQRPMVLDNSFVIDFYTTSDALLIIDGQDKIKLKAYETFQIKMADHSAWLIQPKTRNYFEILREKFQWGQIRHFNKNS